MLENLKIIELASVLAGPSVGMFFAEAGATVLKIENKPAGGDVTRSWKLPNENPESNTSAYYSSVNWGKTSLWLDLNDPADKTEVLRLLRDADIVIVNFKPGDAEKFGLDYTPLSTFNSQLIYAQLTGFGDKDPRPAFDVVLQAETGFMSMNGQAGAEPVKLPLALIDVLAAHQLKEAVLLALLKREKTGKGSQVSVSLYDTAVCSLINQASNYLMCGYVPQPSGSLHPNIAPYGETFACADKKELVLAIGSNAQFGRLCRILGEPALASDPRYADNPSRVVNRQALADALAPLIAGFTRDKLLETLTASAVPAGALRSLDEVFAQERAQQLVLEEIQEGQLTRRVRSIAFSTDFLHD